MYVNNRERLLSDPCKAGWDEDCELPCEFNNAGETLFIFPRVVMVELSRCKAN